MKVAYKYCEKRKAENEVNDRWYNLPAMKMLKNSLFDGFWMSEMDNHEIGSIAWQNSKVKGDCWDH